MGPDALEVKWKDFKTKFAGSKTTLKSFLLNQENIAGVGNLYADEICYRAKIHPGSRIYKLNDTHKKSIFQQTQAILKEAVERTPHYKNYPEPWFWDWRVEGNEGVLGVVQKTKIAGRTTYFWTPGQILLT